MNQKTLLLLAAAGLGIWYLAKKHPLTRLGMLTYLNNWADAQTTDTTAMKEHVKNAFIQMTDQELADVYTLVHDYFVNGNKPVPPGSALQLRLLAISDKYDIFT